MHPSWFVPFLEYFDLTKSVWILSFHHRNQLFARYLRYRQLLNVVEHFQWSCTHAKSQILEVLGFYVVVDLSLAKKVTSQL